MNYALFLLGFVIGALLIGIVLKSKNSSLQAQIELIKEQNADNEKVVTDNYTCNWSVR